MAMTAVQLSIVFVPIAIYGVVKRSKEIFRLSAVTVVLVFMQAAILYMVSFDSLSTLQYNWLQKFIVFICAILLCKPLGVTPKECGYFLPSSRSALLFALLIGTVYAGIDIVGIEEHKVPTVETVLFQLTMPGLQEEPFYRGLLLSLWDKHFGRPIKVLGVNFGLGSVITTAIFTVLHLVFLDENWKVAVNPNVLEWINFIVFSFVMCWLRYKFESVWPCVLAHNFDNGFVKLFSWFVSTHHRN
jgi:membrane protease YdiL (CAAX protease family)